MHAGKSQCMPGSPPRAAARIRHACRQIPVHARRARGAPLHTPILGNHRSGQVMHAASALPAGRRPPALAMTPDFGHPLGVVGTSPHSLSRAAGLSYSVLSSIPVPVSSRRKPRPPPPLQSAGEPLSPFFTQPLSAQLASTGSSAELGPATMVERSLMVCHTQPTLQSASHYAACVPAVVPWC